MTDRQPGAPDLPRFKVADEIQRVIDEAQVGGHEPGRININLYTLESAMHYLREPAAPISDSAEKDVITLCLRLCLEPADSHSPETREVLERYRPQWEAAAGGKIVAFPNRSDLIKRLRGYAEITNCRDGCKTLMREAADALDERNRG